MLHAPASGENDEQFVFGEILRRRWKVAAKIFLGVSLLAGAYMLFWPHTYESVATLYIEPPSRYGASPASFLAAQGGAGVSSLLGMGNGADIPSQMLLMQSDDNLNEVKRRLGINEKLINFRKDIKLTADKDSPSFIDIAARGKTPEQARAIANTLVDVYHEYIDREDSTDVGRSMIVIRQQLKTNEGRLKADENGLVAYSHKSGVLAPDTENQQRIIRTVELKTDLLTAQARLYADQGQDDYYSKQAAGTSSIIVPSVTFQNNPALLGYKQRLSDLVIERSRLATLYTASDDEMVQNAKQIDGVKAAITQLYKNGQGNDATASESSMTPPDTTGSYIVQTATKALNPLSSDLRKSIIGARADALAEQSQIAALNTALTKLNADLITVPDKNRTYNDIAQSISVDTQIEKALRLDLADLEPRKGQQEVRLQLAERPDLPKHTSQPRLMFAGLGVLAGLILGLFAMIRSHSQDKSLRGLADVPGTLGLPILAVVPQLETGSSTPESNKDSISIFKKLAIELGFLGAGSSIKSVLVTSPRSGEGVSTIASRLAMALSDEGKRVILVDANVRHPAQHKLFNMSNSGGFSSVMRNGGEPDKALMSPRDESALQVIPSGPLEGGTGMADMLDAQKLRVVMTALELRCDIVIIDSPSIYDGLSAASLAELVNGAIVVAALDHTSREDTRRAVSLLSQAKTNILGTVVNTSAVKTA